MCSVCVYPVQLAAQCLGLVMTPASRSLMGVLSSTMGKKYLSTTQVGVFLYLYCAYYMSLLCIACAFIVYIYMKFL